MIERALARFLRTRPDVTNYVGQRVSLERRQANGRIAPPPEVGELAITVGRVSGNRQYALRGEIDTPEVVLRMTIYSKGGAAVEKLFDVFEIIRQHISGFRGSWDETKVLGCTWETEGTEAEAPTDAGDYWNFSYGTDLRIHYKQPASPVWIPYEAEGEAEVPVLGIESYDTITDLQAATPVLQNGITYRTRRYSSSHTADDGSGGAFLYDAGSVATIDGGFVIDGPGGIGRLLRLDRSGNVMQFGAVGDGSTDDTAAIQAAVDAIKSQQRGEVFFPAGVYRISSTIALGSWSGGAVRGEGLIYTVDAKPSFPDSASVLQWAGDPNGVILSWEGQAITFDQLSFDGNALNATGIKCGRTVGIATGNTEFGVLYFEECAIAIDINPTTNANTADMNFRHIIAINCTSVFKVRQSQNVNYVFGHMHAGQCGIVYDFAGGGNLTCHHTTLINTDRCLYVTGAGTGTGSNNASFNLGHLYCDAQQDDGTPQLVAVTANAGGARTITIDSIRLGLGGYADDGRHLFWIKGDTHLIVHSIADWNPQFTNGLLIDGNNPSGRYAKATFVDCGFETTQDIWDAGAWMTRSGKHQVEFIRAGDSLRRRTWPDKIVGFRGDEFTVTTTDATPTAIGGYSTLTNESYHVVATIIARETVDSDEVASYHLAGTFRNDGGTLTQVGTTTVLHSAETTGGWNAALTVSGTGIFTTVTGAAATSIKWRLRYNVTIF